MLKNEEKAVVWHVDTFNLDPGGTLMVELTTDPTQVPGVEATNANVNGTILALYNRGFYDHELVYEDVADSPNLAVDELPSTSTTTRRSSSPCRSSTKMPSISRPPDTLG